MVAALERRLGSWVRRAARSPIRMPISWAYLTAVNAEIAAMRLLARRVAEPYGRGDLTVVVKTFERPAVLRRMLASIRRVFAGPIIVADDSRTPVRLDDPAVSVLRMDFDSGVGAGRNLLLATATTPYIWMCDDDIIVPDSLDVAAAVDYLERNPGVDLRAGRMINLPQLRSPDYTKAALFAQPGDPRQVAGTLIDGLPVRYKTPAFYIGRTEAVRAVGYDSRLKRLDHNDFFTAAYGNLVAVQDRDWWCLHAHALFDAYYQSFRTDYGADQEYLSSKWAGGSLPVSASGDVPPDVLEQLRLAAVRVVSRDAGLAFPPGPDELATALGKVGWRRTGGRLRHPLWGEFDPGALSESLGEAPSESLGQPPSTVLSESRDGLIRWSEHSAVAFSAARTFAAVLPSGPILDLQPPADLIWDVIGADGAPEQAIIDRVLGHFDDPPPGAGEQIRSVIDQLARQGVISR